MINMYETQRIYEINDFIKLLSIFWKLYPTKTFSEIINLLEISNDDNDIIKDIEKNV